MAGVWGSWALFQQRRASRPASRRICPAIWLPCPVQWLTRSMNACGPVGTGKSLVTGYYAMAIAFDAFPLAGRRDVGASWRLRQSDVDIRRDLLINRELAEAGLKNERGRAA